MNAFSIRSLAGGGTTLEALRTAVIHAPPESNLVFVRTQGDAIRFPSACPNCGLPASSTMRIERAFLFHVEHDSETPNETVQAIDAFDVPFCGACLDRQQAERRAPSPWMPLRRILSHSEGFAGLVVIAIAMMFVSAAVRERRVFPLVLGSLPLAIGFWLLRGTWKRSRHMSLAKPTSVDLAVDFTPSIALPFEPYWRAFHFRAPQYAALFRQVNAGKLWDPRSPEARDAAAKRRRESSRTNLIVGAIVVAVLLWTLWQEVVSQYVLPEVAFVSTGLLLSQRDDRIHACSSQSRRAAGADRDRGQDRGHRGIGPRIRCAHSE